MTFQRITAWLYKMNDRPFTQLSILPKKYGCHLDNFSIFTVEHYKHSHSTLALGCILRSGFNASAHLQRHHALATTSTSGIPTVSYIALRRSRIRPVFKTASQLAAAASATQRVGTCCAQD